MKRFCACLICIILLLSASPFVFAAGSASLSGPSVVRAGDTITLSFAAGGNIYGGSGSISYDASQLTLNGYTPTIGGSWAVEFNGNNFVFYDNSMSSPITGNTTIFQAVFTVNSSVSAGSNISVNANNVVLSDGKQDIAVGNRAYSVSVAPPLSGNCDLASLTVSNTTISPAFSPDVTSYSVSVPYAISSLTVAATAEDANAQVSINNPTLKAASTTEVTITVTAENGTTKVYTIYAKRAQDPNYIKSNNANLASLAVDNFQLSPAFSVDITQYYVWLPYETSDLSFNVKPEFAKASATVSEYGQLVPGEATNIVITVTAEDGTQRAYTVTAFRAPMHENIDDFLERISQPVTEPTVPPTEPVTEPTTAPTSAPTTAPTTEPSTLPPTQPTSDSDTQECPNNPILYILVGVVCAILGAAFCALFMTLSAKKKQST